MMYDIQKASFGKRISAYIFDAILMTIVATGLATFFSFVFGYDAKYDEYTAYHYKYAEEYGINLEITDEEYNALSEEERKVYDDAESAFLADDEVARLYVIIVDLTILIISFSLLGGFLILEFAVPLFLKNGQTVGKKIFGIAVIGDNSVKVKPAALFVRSILGKYTIETMVPLAMIALVIVAGAGIMGILALFLLIIFEIALLIRTDYNSTIHDLLSYTVAVDLASQMIFESDEEMVAYKNRIQAELASRDE